MSMQPATLPVTPDLLARLAPVSGLGSEGLQQAVSLAHHEAYQRGRGSLEFSWDHKVVYLLKGELKLDYPDGNIQVVVGGCGTTTLPLTRGTESPLCARAITDVELLWFDENSLDILVAWDQMVPPAAPQRQGKATTPAAAANWRTLTGIFDVRKLTLGTFANLPVAHIEELLACFQRLAVKAGDVVVRQHEPGDYYYVIERGRALVSREVTGAHIELAELKAGDAFGEEALLAETCRNATVTMKTDGSLLRLDGADFARLLREPFLKHIDAREAQRRVAAGGLWLDVRFPAEYRQDGLPDAVNIPLNELRNALPSLRKDREYIAYCQTGRRSSAAAFLLSQRGFSASLLEGGLKTMKVLERVAA